VELHLFNNMKHGVLVTYTDRLGRQQVSLHRHQVLDFLGSRLEIQGKECVLVYEWEKLPPAEYVQVGAVNRHVHLQLEPDLRIFVLRAQDEAPVNAAAYAQPEGFPLVPTKKCGG